MWIRSCLLITITLLCTACGWQLRGALQLPEHIDTVAVQNQGATNEFTRALEQRLRSSKVLADDTQTSNDLTIVLKREINERRTASVDTDALASEYTLLKTVYYSVRDPKGQWLAQDKSVKLVRTYAYNPNSVISTGREEQLLKEEMHADAATQILRQVRQLLKNSPPPQ